MDNALIDKLNIKPGQTAVVINAPSDYMNELEDLPAGVLLDEEPVGKFDFVQVFVQDIDEINRLVPNAIGALKSGATFWVSYPKQDSQIETDITKDVGWDLIYDHKFKPVDQIIINDMWEAKRFVRKD